jgi:hypothetical protein
MHLFIVPEPEKKFLDYHPGLAAKRAVDLHTRKSTPEESKAFLKAGNLAYIEAMRDFQDVMHREVFAPLGLDRYGPRKERLSRQEQKIATEKRAALKKEADTVAQDRAALKKEAAKELADIEAKKKEAGADIEARRASLMTFEKELEGRTAIFNLARKESPLKDLLGERVLGGMRENEMMSDQKEFLDSFFEGLGEYMKKIAAQIFKNKSKKQPQQQPQQQVEKEKTYRGR